jgi:hypothetical protein
MRPVRALRLRQRIACTYRGVHGQTSGGNELSVYQALSQRHLSVDIRAISSIQNPDELADYRIVFFPHAHVGETVRFGASGAPLEAPIFNEVLASVADEVSVLAAYEFDDYTGKPAVTPHRMGHGRVAHFGTFFTSKNAAALLDALAIQDPFAALADMFADIQVNVALQWSRTVLFPFELHGVLLVKCPPANT